MDEMTFTLNSPITEEQWDMIADVDFEHTNEIMFYTKHGKEVKFVKEPHWIPCSERLPDSGRYLVSCSLSVFSPQVLNYDADNREWFYDGCKSIGYTIPPITAWMPLPKPYGGESE